MLKRGEKFFEIDLNGKHDTVSIDRLKSAYFSKNNNSSDQHSEPAEDPVLNNTQSTTAVNHDIDTLHVPSPEPKTADTQPLVQKNKKKGKRGRPSKQELARRSAAARRRPASPLPLPTATTRSGRPVRPPSRL